MKLNTRVCAQVLFLPMLIFTTSAPTPVVAATQQAAAVPAEKPVIVEWVYRVQYGHKDEWWRIFKKYQIAILERQGIHGLRAQPAYQRRFALGLSCNHCSGLGGRTSRAV
jgi:hypothetical protein